MSLRLITPLLLLLCSSVFSQDLSYEVRKTYTRSIHQEKARTAASMADLMSGYPSSWITEYISVEVSGTCEGNMMRAAGVNDTLNAAQMRILKTTDLGTDLIVNIAYSKLNAVTGEKETRNLNYQATVIPDSEAEYTGGSQEMNQYLRENAILKIGESASKQLKQAVVRFTITEKGEIANAQMAMPSGDPVIDGILLEAIIHMPQWKPAVTANGLYVEQVFEFFVGTAINGC
jgi:hypothetical protein